MPMAGYHKPRGKYIVTGTDKNGKKLYGSVYGKTFDEAKAKQKSMLQKQPPITEILNENQYTLQTISKEWLNSIRISVKESTYQKYETAVHNHILNSYLTTKKLRDLNTKEIYQFAEQLCANGLSAKTVNDI